MKLVSLALAALPLPIGGAPKEFRILRAGMNATEKGDFLFDEQAAEMVMAAYAAKNLDKIQIDYEHQSLQAPAAGGDAAKPAAGWFRPEVRAGELWATDISWTARARSMLAPTDGAPEYRFYSPVLGFDEETRRVVRLKNLALTNDPAMDGIGPLAAASARKEDEMPCESCTALASKLKDKEAECSALTAKLSAYEAGDKDKGAAMSALTAVRSSLCALTGQKTEDGALGVVEAWKKDAADVAQLRADAAKREGDALEAELTALVDAAVKGGKVEPAKKADTIAMAKGEDGKISRSLLTKLSGFLGAVQPKVKPNGEGGPTEKTTGTAVLTAEDAKVAKLFGHDLKEVEAHKTKQIEDKARAALAG